MRLLLVTGLASAITLGLAAPASADGLMWQPSATLGQPWKVQLTVDDPSGADSRTVTAWFRPKGGSWAPTSQTFVLPRAASGGYSGTMDVAVTAPGDWAFCYPNSQGQPYCGVPDIDGVPAPFPLIAAPETIKQGVTGFAYGSGNLPAGSIAAKPGSFAYSLPVVFSPAAGQNAVLEWGYLNRSGAWTWQKARTVPVPTTPGTPVNVQLTRPPVSQFPKIITSPMGKSGGFIGVAYRLRLPAVNGLAEVTSPDVRVSWKVAGKEVPKKWRFPSTSGNGGTTSCLSCSGVSASVTGGVPR